MCIKLNSFIATISKFYRKITWIIRKKSTGCGKFHFSHKFSSFFSRSEWNWVIAPGGAACSKPAHKTHHSISHSLRARLCVRFHPLASFAQSYIVTLLAVSVSLFVLSESFRRVLCISCVKQSSKGKSFDSSEQNFCLIIFAQVKESSGK